MRLFGDGPPTEGTSRATCQLVGVTDEGAGLVVDLVHLGGDRIELGPAEAGEPLTVGLSPQAGVSLADLEELRSTLHDWNAADGVCELFIVPGDTGQRLILVHGNQVLVIDAG